MNFNARVIEIDKLSVKVQAFHDLRIITWAQWQTDLNLSNPYIGAYVNIRVYGGLKMALYA